MLPDLTEIHLFLDGDNLKIETESGKYNISTLPSDDFPIFELEEAKSQINISSKNLKSIISNTSFAMGNQDWRHYLNGLYLSVADKNITAVATDAVAIAASVVVVFALVVVVVVSIWILGTMRQRLSCCSIYEMKLTVLPLRGTAINGSALVLCLNLSR